MKTIKITDVFAVGGHLLIDAEIDRDNSYAAGDRFESEHGSLTIKGIGHFEASKPRPDHLLAFEAETSIPHNQLKNMIFTAAE